MIKSIISIPAIVAEIIIEKFPVAEAAVVAKIECIIMFKSLGLSCLSEGYGLSYRAVSRHFHAAAGENPGLRVIDYANLSPHHDDRRNRPLSQQFQSYFL